MRCSRAKPAAGLPRGMMERIRVVMNRRVPDAVVTGHEEADVKHVGTDGD